MTKRSITAIVQFETASKLASMDIKTEHSLQRLVRTTCRNKTANIAKDDSPRNCLQWLGLYTQLSTFAAQ